MTSFPVCHDEIDGSRRVVRRCYMAIRSPSSTGAAMTRASVHSERTLKARLTFPQRRRIEPPLRRSSLGADEYPVELRAVERDQQQVDAGIERLDHGRADVVLIDRAHHQVVGHHDALIIPLLANDAIDDEA